MPPYQKNASKAQQRLMFAKEARGELRKGEAIGRARASKGKRLPEKVRRRKRRGKRRG